MLNGQEVVWLKESLFAFVIGFEVIVNQFSRGFVIAGIDGHFSDHPAQFRVIIDDGSDAVPYIIQREKRLDAHLAFLVHRLYEGASELNGLRQVVADETFGIMEEMRRCDERLPIDDLRLRAE